MPSDGNRWAITQFKNCMKKKPKTEEDCYLEGLDDCAKKKVATAWIQGKSTTAGIDCTRGGRRRRTKRTKRRRTKRRRTKRRRTKRRRTKRTKRRRTKRHRKRRK